MRNETLNEMERLPPDQRAVLSLVLTQRKSYSEVSSLLGIPEHAVRERAHAALDALAASATGAAAPETLAAHDLHATPSAAPTAPGIPPAAPSAGAHLRSSKLGGALLLGGIAVVIAVTAILLSGGGGKGQAAMRASSASSPSSSASRSGSAGSTGSGSAGSTGGGSAGSTGAEGVHIDKRLALAPAEGASTASGEGFVLSQGNQRAFYVAAKGLPPSSGFFYAVWLYNSSSDAYPLGRAPAVKSNGLLEGGGPLSAPRLGSFHRIVITRETNSHPRTPGPIVLSGAFALR